MISMVLLTVYLALEILRPDVLLPGVEFQVMSWIAVALLVSCAVETIIDGKGVQMDSSSRFSLGLLAVGVVSTVLSIVMGYGQPAGVLDLAKGVCLYLVILQTVDRESRLRYLRFVVVGLVLLLAAGGVLFGALDMAVPGYSWEVKLHRIRYTGTLSDSNDLGQVYVLGLSILIYAAVNSGGFIRRTLGLLAAAIAGWAIFLTVSRGAMLASMASVAVTMRRRMGVVLPAILVAGLLLTLMVLQVGRMGQMNAGEESAEARLLTWTQGWYMLRTHPILGVGPANYTSFNPVAAHSSLVQIGAETGLLGLFCWVGFLFLPIVRQPSEEHADTAVAFIGRQFHCALISCLVAGLFLSRAYVSTPFLAAGMVMASHRINAAEAEEENEALLSPTFWKLACFQMALIIFWRFSIRGYVEGI